MKSRFALLALISALASCNGPEGAYQFGNLNNITVLNLIEEYFQVISPIMHKLSTSEHIPLSENHDSLSETLDTTSQENLLQGPLSDSQIASVRTSLRMWCDSLPKSQLNPCNSPTFSILMNNLKKPLIASDFFSSSLITLPISIYLESLLFPLRNMPHSSNSYLLFRTCRGLEKIIVIASKFSLTLTEEEKSLRSQCESFLSSTPHPPLPPSLHVSFPNLDPSEFTPVDSNGRAEFVDRLLQLRNGAIMLIQTSTGHQTMGVPKILAAAENLSESLRFLSISSSPFLSSSIRKLERASLLQIAPVPYHYGQQLIMSFITALNDTVATYGTPEAFSYVKGFVLPLSECFSTLNTLFLLYNEEEERRNRVDIRSSPPLSKQDKDSSLLSLTEEELASIFNLIPEAKRVSPNQDNTDSLIANNMVKIEEVNEAPVKIEEGTQGNPPRVRRMRRDKSGGNKLTAEQEEKKIQLEAERRASMKPKKGREGNRGLPSHNSRVPTQSNPEFSLSSFGSIDFLDQSEGRFQSLSAAPQNNRENPFSNLGTSPGLRNTFNIEAFSEMSESSRNMGSNFNSSFNSFSGPSTYEDSFSGFLPSKNNFPNPPKNNFPRNSSMINFPLNNFPLNNFPLNNFPDMNAPLNNFLMNPPTNAFTDSSRPLNLGFNSNPSMGGNSNFMPPVSNFMPPTANLSGMNMGNTPCKQDPAVFRELEAIADSGRTLVEGSVPPAMHDILKIVRYVYAVTMKTFKLPLQGIRQESFCLDNATELVGVMQKAVNLAEAAFQKFFYDQGQNVPSHLDISLFASAQALANSFLSSNANMSTLGESQEKRLSSGDQVIEAVKDLIVRITIIESKIFALSATNMQSNRIYLPVQSQQQFNGASSERGQDNSSRKNLRRQNANTATDPNFAAPQSKPQRKNPQQTGAERSQAEQARHVPPMGTNPLSSVNNGPKATKSLNDKRRPTNEDLSSEVKKEFIEEESGAGERNRAMQRQEEGGEAGDASNSGRKKVKGENDVAIEKQ